MTLTFGITYSYTDFFTPLRTAFNLTSVSDSTVPAVSLLVFSLGSLLGGYLGWHIGFRKMCYLGTILIGVGVVFSSQISSYSQLIVLFGIVASMGSALVVIPATSLAVKWFVKKRGVAVGLMAAGSGSGTLIVPPIAELLIQRYGWRDSLLFVGLGFLILLVFASYFMQTPEEVSMKPYGYEELTSEQMGIETAKGYTAVESISTRAFWMMYAMFALGTFASSMFIVHDQPFAATLGIDKLEAALALSLLGLGSLVSRVVIGIVSDAVGRMRSLIIAYASVLLSLGAVPFVGANLYLFYLCAFGIGFGYGGYLTDFISLSGDLFGRKWNERIWGMLETAFGLGGLAGPISAGIYFDAFSSYTGVFELGTVAVVLGLGLSLLLPRTIRNLHMKEMSRVRN
jgi:MFS transporter, OFA family, oxalate/formate antiporter